ncbi:TPA: ATP-dependent helicase, partial [Enterococcus faecium]|nr:ATP-dependent helicase [Enterococcus faecium]
FKLAILYFTESGEKVRRRKLIANDILIILKNEFGIEVKDYFIDLDLLQLINSVKRMYSGDDNGVDLYKFVTKHIFVNLNIDEKNYPSIFKHYLFFINEVEDRIKNNSLSSSVSSFKKMFKSRDGITLTTAHKVKGNEYDTVIAINLLNGKIPHWNEIFNVSDKGISSARKLLYVICSRAKNNLFLFSEVGYFTSKGDLLYPTQLLDKIEFDYNI